MEIVIDIDEELAKKGHWYTDKELWAVVRAVQNGTPLPKDHGDLIDRNKIEYLKAIHDAKYGYISWSEAIKKIKYSTPTIIEADTESEEV